MYYNQSQRDSVDIKVNDSEADSLLFIKPDDNMYPKQGNYFSNEKFQKELNKKRALYAASSDNRQSKGKRVVTDRHKITTNSLLPGIKGAKTTKADGANLIE